MATISGARQHHDHAQQPVEHAQARSRRPGAAERGHEIRDRPDLVGL
jgi:hypothetical protein